MFNSQKARILSVSVPLFAALLTTSANAAGVGGPQLTALAQQATGWGVGIILVALIGTVAAFMFARDHMTELLGHLSKWVIGGSIIVGATAFMGVIGLNGAAGAVLY